MGLLSRLWSRRRTDRSSVFTCTLPGGELRHYDPMVVRTSLNKLLPEWADLVDQVAKAAVPLPPAIQQADPTAAGKRQASADAAALRLADVARTVFTLPELGATGQGYTAREVLDTLVSYLDYCGKVLESTRPL